MSSPLCDALVQRGEECVGPYINSPLCMLYGQTGEADEPPVGKDGTDSTEHYYFKAPDGHEAPDDDFVDGADGEKGLRDGTDGESKEATGGDGGFGIVYGGRGGQATAHGGHGGKGGTGQEGGNGVLYVNEDLNDDVYTGDGGKGANGAKGLSGGNAVAIGGRGGDTVLGCTNWGGSAHAVSGVPGSGGNGGNGGKFWVYDDDEHGEPGGKGYGGAAGDHGSVEYEVGAQGTSFTGGPNCESDPPQATFERPDGADGVDGILGGPR